VTRSIYHGRWRIDLDVRDGVPRVLAGTELARVAATALDAVHTPAPASIGLILADDAELASLNEEHMDVAGPTDVLSFPLLSPAAFAPGAGVPNVPRPPRARLHLGDIVLSVERAIDQADAGRGGQTGDVRWSPADELRLLITHGVLHVCGWDHATPGDEAAMRNIERRILDELGSRVLGS
jgi:probable rRNA maturation factor